MRLVGLEDVEGDTWDREFQPEPERSRAHEAAARVGVVDDLAVLDLDPGFQVVRLAEPVGVAQPLEVALLDAVRRRLVVVVPMPSSNGSFGIPSIASDGIHEIAVTEDSYRIAVPFPVAGGSTLEELRRLGKAALRDLSRRRSPRLRRRPGRSTTAFAEEADADEVQTRCGDARASWMSGNPSPSNAPATCTHDA